MSPVFTKPALAGSSLSWQGEQTVRPAPSIAATVAIPFTHDWGPLDTPILLSSFGDFDTNFGNSNTQGRDAVMGAFIGSGVAGEPGAGGVLANRMAGSSAAKATSTIQNTTPAAALRLDGLYYGTRGNRITRIVETDPVTSANDRIRILFDGVTVETYSYARTNINDAAAQINAASRYVTATVLQSGVGLTLDSTGTALSGGDDGSTLTGSDWTEAQTALEFQPFTVFCPFDLTDATITAALVAWIKAQAVAGRPAVLVTGGPAAESFAAALTRVALNRDEHVVTLGAGTYHDDFYGKDVSTSQLASRLAGIIAGRGEKASPLFARLVGVHAVGTPAVSVDQLDDAEAAGLTVLTRTTAADAELMIADGVTTYIANTATKPVNVFGDPRLVRVMDLFQRDMKKWGDETLIGDTTVRPETKATVRMKGRSLIQGLIDDGLIFPGGPSDPDNTPFFNTVDTDDPALESAIPYEFGWKFTKTTKYLIGQGKVR